MTMNERLMENYNGNTGKNNIDSNLQYILADEIVFHNKVKRFVTIDMCNMC